MLDVPVVGILESVMHPLVHIGRVGIGGAIMGVGFGGS